MSPARFLRPSRRGAACWALCLSLLHVAACAELAAGAGQGAAKEDAGTAQAVATTAVSAELVPAPALFEATGTARWDGRRTFQGVWVAHPQAGTARRVRIYNAATGAAADGALFTRDAALTGPPMLVSSEAASLLGLAPGAEAELRVVAVMPRATAGGAVVGAVSAAAARGRVTNHATAPVADPATPWADGVATGRAPTSTDWGAAARANLRVPVLAGAVTPTRASAAAAANGDPLPAAAAPAAAPIAAAPTAEASTARAPTAAAPAEHGASRQPAVAPARPYAQAGPFAAAGHAEHLIRRFEAEGLPALGTPVRLATGPDTRVLGGPFATAAERDAARRRIQAMGPRDAIPVAR